MIPYHDENETVRPAIVTLALIAMCVIAWLIYQGAGAEMALVASVCNSGLIPGELTQTLRAGMTIPMSESLACVIDPGPQYANVITSMFLHGGWMHLIGNMWFLWLFGNNVEDSMTRPRFIAFYLLCGLGAAMAQVLAEPTSPVPMVGASGAISGATAARLHLHDRGASGVDDVDLLDGHSDFRWSRTERRRRRRRRRVLGARGRFRGRCRPDQAVREAQSRARARGPALPPPTR
jgi:membrane associated rhomboid family serine protease